VKCIAYPDDAKSPTIHAAEKLAEVLGKMASVRLPVVPERKAKRPAVFVGRTKSMPKAMRQWLDSRKPWAGAAAIEVDARGNTYICGPHDWATWWAVGDFLHQEGYRWYIPSPEGVEIPVGHSLAFKRRSYRHESPFVLRDPPWQSSHLENILEWRALNGYWISYNAPEVIERYGAGQPMDMGSNHREMYFMSEDLFKQHPDWFAMVDGKRVYTHFEYTNPEALNYVAEQLIAQIRALKEPYELYTFGMADTGKFSQSPEAKAFGTTSDNVFSFVQQLADRVSAVFPNFKILQLSYADYPEPPTKVKLKNNIIVIACMWGSLGVSDTTFPAMDPKLSPKFRDLLIKWNQAAPGGLFVRSYWGDYDSFTPYPMLRNMCYDLKEFAKNGVIGLENEFHPHWAANGLYAWSLGRLLWNPDLTEDELTRDWCKGYWGAAEKPMLEMQRYLQDSYASKKDVYRGRMTEEAIAKCDGWMAEAGQLLKDSPERFAWRYELANTGWKYSARFLRAINTIEDVKADQWDANTDPTALSARLRSTIVDLHSISEFAKTPLGEWAFCKNVSQAIINKALSVDLLAIPTGHFQFQEQFDRNGGYSRILAESTEGFYPYSSYGLGVEKGQTGQLTYRFKTADTNAVFDKVILSFFHLYKNYAGVESPGNAVKICVDGKNWIVVQENKDFRDATIDLSDYIKGKAEFQFRIEAKAPESARLELALDAMIMDFDVRRQ